MSTTAEHGRAASGTSPGAGTAEDYTPHGYLDVRGHTVTDPKGVVRAVGPTVTWHMPALGRSYGGSREHYRLAVHLVTGPGLTCSYNSSRVKVLHSHSVRSTWFLAGDDTLCLVLDAEGWDADVRIETTYTRRIAAEGRWGESGLVGRQDGGGVLLQGFEGGEAFWLRCLPGPVTTKIVAADGTRTAGESIPGTLRDENNTRPGDPDDGVNGRTGATVALAGPGEQTALTARTHVRVQAGEPTVLTVTRGASARQAMARREHLGDVRHALRAHLAADERFWARAPRLTGDWPAHWRRGLHHDLETLRMMVKDPTGVFDHPWDAMQVHAPRVVLAEAALDALTLSRADPERAAAMFLGTFTDAPAANVPCIREDGSDTMVSADGTACGTGPEWGLPFVVAEALEARVVDPDWLGHLYPPLAAYLDFWLAHRRDAGGWLVHACSWESGQDLSPRFGPQPLGGGHPTWHVRPVDLHAAAAHGARVLARFAERVAPADAPRWHAAAEDLTARTRRLWDSRRFADQIAGSSTATEDVMLLLPVALGIADADQEAALTDPIQALAAESLTWPAPTWVALLALQRTGGQQRAAEHVSALLDRVYHRIDARAPVDGSLPGVAQEYWPTAGSAGGEAYGWGAFTTELFFAVVLGLEIDHSGIRLTPRLPASLRAPGLTLGVSLTARTHRIELTLAPTDQGLRVNGLGESELLAPGQGLHRSWTELADRAGEVSR